MKMSFDNILIDRAFIYFLTVFFLGGSLISCTSRREDPKKQEFALSPGIMVLVCSEGNFRWGNASLGLLNLATNQWDENAYKTLTGKALGDVCQSVSFWQEEWWIVVNNSAKIEIVNEGDMRPVKTLEGFISPRFVCPVSSQKGYVTDLYAEKIWVVNRQSKQIIASIPFPGWGEEMVLFLDDVWVMNKKKNKLYKIDTRNDILGDSISFPGNLTSITQSGTGIWVAFDSTKSSMPGIAHFNPLTKIIDKTVFSSSEIAPQNLQHSSSGDTVFFIQDKPKMLNVNSSEWPVSDLLDGKTGNFYGLGYDPKRQELWVSDAKDYQQKSKLIRKNLANGSIREYPGGIISSRFYFW
jgi:hypothetical protein